MTNLVSTTAGVFSDTGGENGRDDVNLFVGEAMQWRIFLAVA
jgi:hypothetical protein